MHSDDEFSDELDEFEESHDEAKYNGKQSILKDKPYDEVIEVSQDLSMAESYDGRGKNNKEKKLRNDMYDEAVEVSQSMDQTQSAIPKDFPSKIESKKISADTKGTDSKQNSQQKANSELSKSNSISNRHFDEALDFSHSDSDESIDTRTSEKLKGIKQKNTMGYDPRTAAASKAMSGSQAQPVASTSSQQQPSSSSYASQSQAQSQGPPPGGRMEAMPAPTQKAAPSAVSAAKRKDEDASSSDGEGGDEGEEGESASFEHIEGSYNPKDYAYLNVSTEVRDLFQYIERYKAPEVELETTLKCFVPEYIPAIGDMDGFVKVPRPDGQDDGLGLKMLDEPALIQSDPTVLELQLRAMSKKQQHGTAVVRSIENADQNPAAIEKWIQSINELHRSKPPPQVHYKRNMPDIESLMDVWPESFEVMLQTNPLPSPDLDLTLAEYCKVLCSLLDIPTYDNPIESLHVMFSLYTDFKNNPHFQAMKQGGQGGDGYNLGEADVLEVNQGYK